MPPRNEKAKLDWPKLSSIERSCFNYSAQRLSLRLWARHGGAKKRFQHNTNELIACPCATCRKSATAHYHDINAIVGWLLNGLDTAPCPVSYQAINLREIMGEVTQDVAQALQKIEDMLYEIQGMVRKDEGIAIDKLFEAKLGAFGFKVNLIELAKHFKRKP